ncbi:hypothetical protein [Streptomyces candidus]|uniref:Uncharacterized protein n=1 Tax=Streptomyces candidus TaxID=67283 RepID=A0A7X0LTL9_9ACTN|nr:hypothetical protein [Streptomyces candidus]MBB6439559.1 hypothetical protein [Streptomyces candidus]GHH54566.1 hypothetical protein GCM10018773_57720 [Streptomyces candidus]
MRIRPILKNRQCQQCGTYNNPLRLTCMVCVMPMRGVSGPQARAATVVRRVADVVGAAGRWALPLLAVAAFVRRGTELDLYDLVPALAAYGAGQFLTLLLEGVAEWIAPGPTWQEVAEDLRETEKKLAGSGSLVRAVGELSRHGGIAPVIGILRALGAYAMYEKEAAQEAGDVQDADGQERLEQALTAAADEMDADTACTWH